MKTIGISIVSVLLLVPQGCFVEGKPYSKSVITESIMDDSISNMIEFISYIDSAHLVEDVTENYSKMEKKNEELETKLEETKHELAVVKHDLEVAEKLIEIYVPSDTVYTDYQLLPISKANNN